MNILISALAPKVGGGEVMAMTLAAELSKKHNVYLFFHQEQNGNPELQKRLLPPEVTVISTKSFRIFNFLVWKINALTRIILPKLRPHDYFRTLVLAYLVHKYNIEVVSSHSKYSDLSCAKAVQWKRVPLFITEHGEYAQSIKEGKRSDLNILCKADAIVAVSAYNKNMLLECNFKLPPIHLVYNGVVVNKKYNRNAARQKLNIPPGAFVFGMVSRGVKEKGWQQAIDAFLQVEKISDQKSYLILVGGSSYLNSLKERYRHVSSIFFVGQTADPSFYISSFDVGLLPTRFKTESLPLSVIEYLFFNKPVIASDAGGIPEILKGDDKQVGTLIEQKSDDEVVQQLASCMQHYKTDKAFYAKHADNAVYIQEKFSLESCVKHYEALFMDAMDSRSRKS